MRFPFTWWQVLWALLFISGLTFRSRTVAEINDAPIDGWALFRIVCVFTVALVLFLRLSLRKARWLPSLFSGLIGIFLLYPLISLISTIWSVRPLWTLYKSIEFLTDVCLTIAIVETLGSAGEYRKLVNWTWILLGLLGLSAWIGAVFDPADALFSDPSLRIIPLPMRLVGIAPVVSCNDLSELSALLALVALCRLVDPEAQERKTGYRLLFAVAIVTLVVTQTRGSFIAFFIGLVLLLILTRRYLLTAVAGMTSLLVGTGLVLFTNFGTGIQNFLLRGESVDEASGMSGRVATWQESLYKILEHPWTGYGGFAGARFVVLSKNSIASSNLNCYVDSALDLGIVGLVILLVVLVAVGWSLLRLIAGSEPSKSDPYLALEIFIAFTVLVVRSVESSNLITHPMLPFLAILGAAEVFRRVRKSLPDESTVKRSGAIVECVS